MEKMQIGILGSGKIACDLLKKILKSKKLVCKIFSGRNVDSEGIAYAHKLGVRVSTSGIKAILDEIDDYDLIFDATSALSHIEHQRILERYGKTIINLTPTKNGIKCVPAINLSKVKVGGSINMITCGGQASLPIIYSVKECVTHIRYIEVVSTISSESAGIATRLNICEYLDNTEDAIFEFSDCANRKAILNINPAVPPINMQTTIYMLLEGINIDEIVKNILLMVSKVKIYVPYYDLACMPIFEENKLTVIIKVRGLGDYLPTYAGNLDIITSASIQVAEYVHQYIKSKVIQ